MIEPRIAAHYDPEAARRWDRDARLVRRTVRVALAIGGLGVAGWLAVELVPTQRERTAARWAESDRQSCDYARDLERIAGLRFGPSELPPGCEAPVPIRP